MIHPSHLPQDVLVVIFEMVQESVLQEEEEALCWSSQPEPSFGPICRSLLDIQRRCCFSTLRCGTDAYSELESTYSCSREPPLVASYVRNFIIDRNYRQEFDTDDWSLVSKEYDDYDIPSISTILAVLGSMPNLRRLEVTASSRTIETLLDRSSSISFACLQTLVLDTTFTYYHPFDCTVYQRLRELPSLQIFSLRVRSLPPTTYLSTASSNPLLSTCVPIVTHLHLTGPLTQAAPHYLLSFIISFGTPKSLTLSDNSESSRVFSVVNDIEEPEKIENLVIRMQNVSESSLVSFDISKFSNLVSLDLDLDSPSESRIVTALSRLPITTLTLRRYYRTTNELSPFIQSGVRPSRLGEINIYYGPSFGSLEEERNRDEFSQLIPSIKQQCGISIKLFEPDPGDDSDQDGEMGEFGIRDDLWLDEEKAEWSE